MGKPDRCFVIMPFGDPFDNLYREVLAPAIKARGLEPCRADEINKPGVIVDQIWKGINDAKLCVADVSGRNANVMYELGLAHAIGKPVVQLVQDASDLPFDLKALRHIVYGVGTPSDKEALRSQLETMLTEAATAPGSVLALGGTVQRTYGRRRWFAALWGLVAGCSIAVVAQYLITVITPYLIPPDHPDGGPLAVTIAAPRDGEAIGRPYEEMSGTYEGTLPKNSSVHVLAQDQYGFHLMLPPTTVNSSARTWSQRNVALGPGKWKLYVCLADEKASHLLHSRRSETFDTLPEGVQPVKSVNVLRR